MKFTEMDESVTFAQQLAGDEQPVILINKFNVAAEEAAQLLKAWSADADFCKRQPGFICTQLHRGIAGSSTFLNYAIWESTKQFREAFANPEFQSKLVAYPVSAIVSPHLFKKVPVPGICVG